MTAFHLATYQSDRGLRSGLVLSGSIIDVADATGNPQDASVLNLLETWGTTLRRLDDLASTKGAGTIPLDGVALGPPIPRPIAIYCAGANYKDHAEEMARAHGRPPPKDPHDLGLRSWHFIKQGHCVVGHGANIDLPPQSKKVDWEAELAVVIGREAKNVSEQDALDYVMGYTVGNDLSARDLSRRDALPDGSSFKNDWVAHKCFDGSCPMGPWITLERDIGDPHDLAIKLDVNGIEKQNSNTGKMIFSINEQIADLSSRMTLYPGDIIMTGTPAGVGNGRGEFLKAGDVVRVSIEKIGELVNTMT